MIRTSQLKRTGPPARKTPLRKRNPARAAHLHQRNFDGTADVLDHDGWIRAKACCVCQAKYLQQEGRTQACHVIPRSCGGAWWALWPGCRAHHDEQGERGNDWMRERYGVDLPDVARQMTRKHLVAIGAI